MGHQQQVLNRIDDIRELSRGVNNENFWERLRDIVNKEGWTTPAELQLALGYLDSVQGALRNVVDGMESMEAAFGAVQSIK